MNELMRKATLALFLVLSGLLSGRGAEPLSTLCTGTAPTISVPAAWTDGETVPGGTPLVLNAHSLTGDTVTVTVDGLAATFAGGGGTFRWQPWTSGTHTLTHRAGTAVWTLRVSGAQSAAGLPAGAFRDCTNLVAVTLPSGLTEIGAGAFRGCANLVSVVFPSGLAGIGAGAFRDCANLVSVAFPSGLAEIGAGAFEGCPRLARVDVPALRDWFALSFADVDANPLTQGAALHVDGVPVRLEGPRSDRLVIPAGVSRIPAGAFRDCPDIVSVEIPPGVAEIAGGAFSGCTSLASVTVPADVLEMGLDGVFDVSTITNVVLGADVVRVRAGTFFCCPALRGVMIPSGVKGICDSAFAYCIGLEEVEIPSSVTSIGDAAFEGCTSLARVRLPRRFEGRLGPNVFAGCGGGPVLDYYDEARPPDSEVAVQDDGDAAGGTVTGGGTYAAGKKVVLKAVAKKGYVFAGGELEGAALSEGVELQNPSLTLVAGGVDVTARARFIPVSEDWAEVGVAEGSATFAEEYAAGGAFAPVTLAARGGSLAALKVSGLPAGLKFTAKALAVRDPKTKKTVSYPANTVYGTPTRSGIYTVAATATTAGGKTATARWTFAVRKPGERIARTAYNAEQGTVTGGGTYAAGKKVTLKATARKGYVFAGWELEGVALPEGADLQSPSLALVAGDADMTACARFIPVEEDWAEVSGTLPAECAKGAAIAPVTLAARGGSLVAVKVTGLPAGLKFTAKPLTVKATKTAPGATYAANTVYGTPTKSGVYTVVATATTAGRAVAVTNWTVVVRKPGERAVVPSFDAARGTVSGGCVCAPGKKVALKATAKKGYVFAGWTLAGASLPAGADAQAPSISLVAGTSDIAAHAAFIPVEEDWAEVSGTLLAECAKGAAIRPATLAARGGSLVAVKVTGLPAGLKFTAKPLTVKATKTAPAASYPANTVYGTPTKSGVYTVAATATTAGRATAATNWTVVVRGPGERVVRTACDAAHGKVSGAGVYAKGKKATIKATVGKGWVFAGWELEGTDLPAGADARDPSLALAVGESDVTARARFVPAGEDGVLALLVDGAEVPEDGSARFRDAGAGFALEAVSASLPKVALSGLPPGLKYDAKAGRIAGRGTKPGLYTVTAKLSNATVRRAVARTFRIEVPNLRDADALLRDGLANAPGEAYRAYVGVRPAGLPSLVPADPAHAKSLKVSGLPAGLKFDAKAVAAGEVALAGVPSKAGAYTVSVAVAGKTSTFTLEVLPLPDWAVGTFTGCFDETGADGTALCGTAAFTVSAAGKVSAKLVRQDGKAASWTHACLDRAEADAAGGVSFRVDTAVGGFRCEVSISAAAWEGGPAQGVLAGTRRPVDAEDAGEGAVGLAFDCVQNLWGRGKALEGLAAKLKGRKVALPTIRDEQGNTYDVSLAFGAGGAVTAKYRLNGGAAQSASGTLAYRGAGELEAGGGDEEDGEDGEGKTEQVAGSSVSLYLNLVRGGRAFLEVGLLVDGEGVVHWVDGRVAGDGEP